MANPGPFSEKNRKLDVGAVRFVDDPKQKQDLAQIEAGSKAA
jgi:hypothetical protein